MDILNKFPFNLNKSQIEWVETSINEMSLDEKIGQLFFQVGLSTKTEALDHIISKHPGGVMFRPQDQEEMLKAHKYLQENSKLPLLLAANIESGADGLFHQGTKAGNNMLVAASGNSQNAYEQGRISMSEARMVGGNVAFAPVIDINYNFENPITNTRSYGDNPKIVAQMSTAFTKGVQENGGSVMIKHFPGDGTDGRDQHLLKTVNSLAYDDWLDTYGMVYQENIKAGALGMMVGHISLPSYFEYHGITSEDPMIPASLSSELLTNLVRSKFGFNGLIMTDATLMAGFGSSGKREEIVPKAIAAGNDMFLFTKNIDEDFQFMKAGYENGTISEERLHEALTRILGLKAKLNLINVEEQFIDCCKAQIDENRNIASKVAHEAITLVKDEDNLLPLIKGTKIGLFNFTTAGFDGKCPVYESFKNNLIIRGYEVVDLDFGVGFENMPGFLKLSDMTISELKSLADVFIYVAEYLPASNKTSIRINYRSFAGLDAPWFINEVPTMYVSFGSPYHGYDFADIKTGINAYYNSEHVIEAVAEKISSGVFTGTSPVNLDFKPFKGKVK